MIDKIGKNFAYSCDNIKSYLVHEKAVGSAFKTGVKNARFEENNFPLQTLSVDLSFINKAKDLLNDYVLGSSVLEKQKGSFLGKHE